MYLTVSGLLTKAPDWCAAATGTGTYRRRVVIPIATCRQPMPPRARAVILRCGGRGRDWALVATRSRAASVEVPRILWLN